MFCLSVFITLCYVVQAPYSEPWSPICTDKKHEHDTTNIFIWLYVLHVHRSACLRHSPDHNLIRDNSTFVFFLFLYDSNKQAKLLWIWLISFWKQPTKYVNCEDSKLHYGYGFKRQAQFNGPIGANFGGRKNKVIICFLCGEYSIVAATTR